jgi:hypothetical protein
MTNKTTNKMVTRRCVLHGLYYYMWLSSACSDTIRLLSTSWTMVGTLALVVFMLGGALVVPKRQYIKNEEEMEGLGL